MNDKFKAHPLSKPPAALCPLRFGSSRARGLRLGKCFSALPPVRSGKENRKLHVV